MIYIEMARDVSHGGGSWAFPNCVWAPTRKKKGGRWPYWTLVTKVRTDDFVLHLRGKPPQAAFVGYSRASGDGFTTSKRPPDPKIWAYSKEFFRADLKDYTPFHKPINLSDVFLARKEALEAYFDTNKESLGTKRQIFYVRQSGRLQCLNGAYFTEVDDNLLSALFSAELSAGFSFQEEKPLAITIETDSQLSLLRTRIGQDKFSKSVKSLYGNTCCFPACPVNDPRFLIGAHIARWSDNEELRGHMGNGLCLCLMHDRAFELGLFTLDEKYRVFVNPKESKNPTALVAQLKTHHGEKIRLSSVAPLDDALLEHWLRVDISP